MAKTKEDFQEDLNQIQFIAGFLAGLEAAKKIVEVKRPNVDAWSETSEYTEKRICNELIEELQKEISSHGGN